MTMAEGPAISAEEIERGALEGALDPASPQARAAMALMDAYYQVWNAKDAEALASRIYRLEPGRPLQTVDDFRGVLQRTMAEGWDYSTLSAVQVFPWDDDAWLVRGLFNRFAADGRLLPPADRLTAYVVKEFPDGLRITDLPLVYDRA
jgi:hypothetical protein